MGKTFTLDNFRAEVDRKYGPVTLDGVPGGGPIRLLPMLRHDKSRRDEISARMDTMSKNREADAETTDLNALTEQIEGLVELVLENRSDISRIKEAFGDDAQMMISLWEEYQAVTQPGEAEPSKGS